ncbi:TetR/AcrR family transcriptional regulator [Nonomuraea sp. NPDC050404]|uniref:TetR/AcrR family transcriptional regulator n=1 Tax=Nonomuraea sp. NPDC050404 TaxID=3155783 RepID=UPI0033D03C72
MTRSVGRPRDSALNQTIADAVREVLAEKGYAQLTVDAVARRAGVGKAAIYRRHTTKQRMIFASVMHDLELAPPPDTGSLVADLAAVTLNIAEILAGPPPGVVPALLADVHTDESMAAAFSGSLVKAERDCLIEVLERAMARGELSRLPDLATVHAMLLGPIFAWLFLLLEERERIPALCEALAESTARTLLAGGCDDLRPRDFPA